MYTGFIFFFSFLVPSMSSSFLMSTLSFLLFTLCPPPDRSHFTRSNISSISTLAFIRLFVFLLTPVTPTQLLLLLPPLLLLLPLNTLSPTFLPSPLLHAFHFLFPLPHTDPLPFLSSVFLLRPLQFLLATFPPPSLLSLSP